jgi:hypothetical protein
MRQGETFLSSGYEPSLFLIGKNRRGQWVAQDQRCLRGGLFVNRAAALKYALFENGRKPHLVVDMPGNLELDLGVTAYPPQQATASASASLQLCAA